MLAFNRKEGQEIMIGDNIRIVLIRAKGGTARIAIEAPDEIPVHRKEIYDELNGKTFKELVAEKEVKKQTPIILAKKQPWLCDHANEVPTVCRCPINCPCKTGSCKPVTDSYVPRTGAQCQKKRKPQSS